MRSWKSVAFATFLAVGSGGAVAADQSVSLVSGDASFIGTGPLLDGGQDVITFTGLRACEAFASR
jgi:hypothetical protein